jgi:hypothetical protein
MKTTQRTAWGLGEIDFETDVEAFAVFRALLKKQEVAPVDRVYVTLIGLIETLRDRSGSILPRGFGHLGAAPVQLIQRSVSVKDVVIERAAAAKER